MRPAQASAPSQTTPAQPKLLDRVRQATRARHYSKRTEKFIRFQGKPHSRDDSSLVTIYGSRFTRGVETVTPLPTVLRGG